MNPGLSEEAGQTARSLITGLKESPVTLGLMVINVAFLAYIALSERSATQLRRELTTLYIQQQTRVTELLAKCVVPEDR